MSENINIDVDFSFTDDTSFWDMFNANGSSRKCPDPDSYSPTLRSYHQKLWSKKLPNGYEMELTEDVDSYLIWKDFPLMKNLCFRADSIVNMYFHDMRGNKHLTDEIKQYLCDNANEDGTKFNNFTSLYKDYLKKSYTIGGSIIFPKTNSINVARGISLKDRFDLTLECIRLYYLGEKSPLFDTLKANETIFNALMANKPFFDLFIDFKGYVDFFYLNDLVTDDYTAIKYFNSCTDIIHAKYPSSAEDWLALYKNQLAFVKNRNNRIKREISKISL